MLVLCNVSSKDKNKNKIMQCIQASTKRTNVEYFTTTDGFRERLRINLSEKTVAVVSAAKEKDLMDLYFIQHLLSKVVLVLLLPDTERHTIAMGHRLHPYFMCSVDTEVSELMDVLKTIVVHGTPPKSIELLKNPFETLVPHGSSEFNDNWIQAA